MNLNVYKYDDASINYIFIDGMRRGLIIYIYIYIFGVVSIEILFRM